MATPNAYLALLRRTSLHVVLASLAWATGTATAADNTPRDRAAVVFVGHSLINYEMPAMVQQLANSRGFTLHKAVQVINGAPLAANWARCRAADFTGPYPPEQFACDAIEAGSPIGPYDTLIATDANNTIESNRIYNSTHVNLENFMRVLISRKNPGARAFMYTAWESWGFHSSGTWLDAIAGELAQYETIVNMANSISVSAGRPAIAEVLPANVALRELIIKVQRGEIPGITSRTQLFADEVHMSKLGNYFMASVVFSAVFNQSPEGSTGRITDQWNNVLLEVPAATATALQRLAWQVVSDYRGGSPPPGPTRPRAPSSLQVS